MGPQDLYVLALSVTRRVVLEEGLCWRLAVKAFLGAPVTLEPILAVGAYDRGSFGELHLVDCILVGEEPGVHRKACLDSFVINGDTNRCDRTK